MSTAEVSAGVPFGTASLAELGPHFVSMTRQALHRHGHPDPDPQPDPATTPLQAEAINDAMVAEMYRRRVSRPERRVTARRPRIERRAICAYCFQRGNHPTPASCLRALER